MNTYEVMIQNLNDEIKELRADLAKAKGEVERLSKDLCPTCKTHSWESGNICGFCRINNALADIHGLHAKCQQCAITSGEINCVTFQIADTALNPEDGRK